jgi:hypothetical protein
MQGVFDPDGHRFKTKKALKECAASPAADTIQLEATSLFGNEYAGYLGRAPHGKYTVVGPDPYTRRNWYATIEVGKRDGVGFVKVS